MHDLDCFSLSLCVYIKDEMFGGAFLMQKKRCQFAGRYISVWKCEFLIQHNIHWITIIYGSPIEFMETVNICKLFVMLLRHHGKHFGWIVRRIFESAMGRQDSTNKRDKWKMYNVYTRLLYVYIYVLYVCMLSKVEPNKKSHFLSKSTNHRQKKTM